MSNNKLTENEQGLVVIPPALQQLTVARPPDVVLEEAHKAAAALKHVIDSKPKKVVFNGKTYLEAEDWSTVARFYGVVPQIRSTKYVEFGEDEYKVRGYEATADALVAATGQVISSADSMCLSDERNWGTKPLFQLRSMAQTRAASRVLRQVFGWVVVLAGYAPTPAEEMDAVEFPATNERPAVQRKSQKSVDPEMERYEEIAAGVPGVFQKKK